jgi:hypothetical protein
MNKKTEKNIHATTVDFITPQLSETNNHVLIYNINRVSDVIKNYKLYDNSILQNIIKFNLYYNDNYDVIKYNFQNERELSNILNKGTITFPDYILIHNRHNIMFNCMIRFELEFDHEIQNNDLQKYNIIIDRVFFDIEDRRLLASGDLSKFPKEIIDSSYIIVNKVISRSKSYIYDILPHVGYISDCIISVKLNNMERLKINYINFSYNAIHLIDNMNDNTTLLKYYSEIYPKEKYNLNYQNGIFILPINILISRVDVLKIDIDYDNSYTDFEYSLYFITYNKLYTKL